MFLFLSTSAGTAGNREDRRGSAAEAAAAAAGDDGERPLVRFPRVPAGAAGHLRLPDPRRALQRRSKCQN